MSFDWGEYLVLAHELARRGRELRLGAGREARLRASLSRAYYAVFCLTRNHLRDNEGRRIPASGEAHGYVTMVLSSSTDPSRIRVGHDLDQLRRYRNAADYQDDVRGLESLVSDGLVIAQRIAATLRTL